MFFPLEIPPFLCFVSLIYIQNHEIDTDKWDSLVDESANSSLFHQRLILDSMCLWDAVILDDYKGGIPLPKKVKMGMRILYQPSFIQHCSWMGTALTQKQCRELESIVLKHFEKIHFNTFTPLYTKYSKERLNLWLDLNRPYPSLHASYRTNLKRNLKKESTMALTIRESVDTSTLMQYFRSAYGLVNPQIGDKDYLHFQQLAGSAIIREQAFLLEALSPQNEIVASMLFFKARNRIHYLVGAPNEAGRTMNAPSRIFDHVIKTFSGTETILDFEGSSISDVAHFYKGFGSLEEHFREIRLWSNPFLRTLDRLLQKIR